MTPFADLFSALLGPWSAGIGACLLGLALTPGMIHLARRRGWVDQPSADRWHDRPVALMGGIAIAGAAAGGLLLGGVSALPVGVLVGSGFVFAVGLYDDVWSISPTAKVLAQVLAAVLVLYEGIAFWQGAPSGVSMPLTFLWVIGVMNAVNLIDGIDGLAATIAAVAAAALALMSSALGLAGWAVVGASLAGASLGFLAYNVPPARIFMGDCGSLFLGYILAVLALVVQGAGGPVAGPLVPVAVLAVPIFDTTFVTVTRLLRGRSVTEGGTDHTHHRLIELGLSERKAVVTLAAVSMAFGGLALSTLWISPPLVVAIVLLGLVACGIAGGYLDVATSAEPSPTAQRPGALSARIGAVMRTFVGGAHWKAVLGLVADLLVVGAAFVVAMHLRHGGAPPDDLMAFGYRVLPGLIAIKLLVFYACGLYRGIWRHAGTSEIVRLILASMGGSLLAMGGWALAAGGSPPVSLFVIDGLVTTAAVGGVRFSFRALRQAVAAHTDGGRRALVVGTGTPTVLLVRYLREHPDSQRTVVGLLDEDAGQKGRQLQGTKVLGSYEDLPRLCEEQDVEEVVVPVEATTTAQRRALREQCAPLEVDCLQFAVSLDAEANPESAPVASPVGNGARRET